MQEGGNDGVPFALSFKNEFQHISHYAFTTRKGRNVMDIFSDVYGGIGGTGGETNLAQNRKVNEIVADERGVAKRKLIFGENFLKRLALVSRFHHKVSNAEVFRRFRHRFGGTPGDPGEANRNFGVTH